MKKKQRYKQYGFSRDERVESKMAAVGTGMERADTQTSLITV